MKSILAAVFGLALVGPGTAALADCATDEAVAAYVADFLAKKPAKALVPDGTMEDAVCTQEKYVAALSKEFGPVVGYKAGLTSKAAQERFGVSEPVQGVLLRDMLLEDGAEVPADFGARPVFEADLLLVVGDAGINAATTPEEAMAHISEVRPFIELPDLSLAKGEPITGVTLTANAVAARLGVVGAAIPVDNPAAMLQMLADMEVTVTAANGEVLARAKGSAVLGNPVNSVLWLASKGIVFKPGDVVSVGSIGPLIPPAKAGGGATVTYAGLPGGPSVSVVFK
ncbi:2-oxo-hept-3-ene-1,7-dioate hydratase [Rhodobium orientis]|uniref:Hydratase n=1 Tax=Rhodobium orientis TaxID=34017 RepID=A0A327JF58_9HYPH|nr:fumarylacetoacetate hydrolase family protein [Rhodobium orientis]MBB4303438.1 2-oxo-hept-3-ene-1,7-dioate hydratase [Rhodobium orientis]MBK5950372.1 hydratase [Rhodobium orientis]RAI25020.1 hydratase [Rhodobium orientis]